MANTVSNVSAGAPKVTGAIYRAPIGTALPTDATTALNSAFVSLGYTNENGLSNGNSVSVNKIKAWGGDIVLTTQTGSEDTFTFTLIEVLNSDVKKAVYGADNVVETSSLVTTKVDLGAETEGSWVFEMAMRGGVVRRTVVPRASITSRNAINYKDSDAVGYAITLTAMPDASGYTHYEYDTV